MKTIAKKIYLDPNQHNNCAESVLQAASLYFGFTIPPEEAAAIKGFGGGMGCGSTCGALTGAVAACGHLYQMAAPKNALNHYTGALVKAFKAKAGSILCDDIKPRLIDPDVRCFKTVEIGCDVLLEQAKAMGLTGATVQIAPEDIKRVKGLGFLHNKGTNCFSCRVITGNGRITTEKMACINAAAKKHGDGHVCLTTRLTVEIPGIPFDHIEAIRSDLAKAGLETGGTGSKVRPVVSCKGTTCQYGLYDTFGLSERIHETFYKGWHDVTLPHKFKIAVGGCPNNCVKPDLNDLGVIGQRVSSVKPTVCKGCKQCAVEKGCPIGAAQVVDGLLTIDSSKCNNCGRCIALCPFDAIEGDTYGYKVVIGGRWGKKVAQGRALNHFFTSESEIMTVIEKAILLFREQGKSGERFSDTIARIGFDQIEKELLSDAILSRKDAILKGMTVTGGASC